MVRLATSVNRAYLPLLVVFAIACTGGDEQPPAPVTPPPYLTVFLVDGLVQDVFVRELVAGRLPNIDALAREGTVIENGVSSFPSMTGYGFFPFITGIDAAKSGILGLRWLDRDRDHGVFRNYVGRTYERMNEDLKAGVHTIFEVASPSPTHSFNSYMNRGASEKFMSGTRITFAKYRDAWWLGRLVAGLSGGAAPTFADVESKQIDVAIAKLASKPKVQWITFTTPDGYAHVYGLNDGYAERLRDVDANIGRYREASRKAGQEADRVYAVLTDHGLAQVNVNLDLRDAMADSLGLLTYRGQATELWTTDLDTTLGSFADVDGVIAVNGNTMCHVYLRREDRGFSRPFVSGELRAYAPPTRVSDPELPRTVDVIEGLRRLHGIELVVARGTSASIDIFASEGEATLVITDDGRYVYKARGIDPLGYADALGTAALMDGAAHDARAWLAGSLATRFPDALHRLATLFADSNTGDVVVTSIPGYDLAADYEMVVGAYRGGHGGLRADRLIVPYILAGPGVRQRGRVETARAEDVGFMLRQLIGLPTEEASDGRRIDGLLR